MNDDDRYREGTPTSEEEDEDFTAVLDEPAGKMFVQTRSGLGAEEEEIELNAIPQERRMKALSILNDMLEESFQPVDEEKRKREIGSNWKDLMVPVKRTKKESSKNESESLVDASRESKSVETKEKTEDEAEKKRMEEIRRIASEVLKQKNQTTTQETKVKFAGQEITIERDVMANESSTLDTLLSSISDKKTLTTMDKTSYDWEKYKKESGEKDEVEKAKENGFIEKQEFLNRVDQRRFEIEKAEREKERYKRDLERAKRN